VVVDVLVVGGGLGGLTAAVALHAAGRSVTVVEARPAVGGQIRTIADGDFWVDLGATWHWSNQPAVGALAASVGLASFPQFREGRAIVEDDAATAPRPMDLAPPSPTELRFAGGTQALCHRLASRLPEGAVLLETGVTAVSLGQAGVTVTTVDRAGGELGMSCGAVVVAVPPRLAWAGITFTPALPDRMAEVLQGTPTWMATAVKCVAEYESAFWRRAGLSGQAFSRGGPLIEVHDCCTDDGTTAALWGFLSASHEVRDLDVETRMQAVFAQLGRLFGPDAADPVRYFERDWSDDPYTNDEVTWFGKPLPLGHPAFAEALFDGRLVWAGSETADIGAGHMEGAVRSGQRAATQVLARTDRR